MSRGWRVAARAATWPLVPVLLGGVVVLDLPDVVAGPTASDLVAYSPYFVAILATYVVGVVLTWRVPDQGAGWAFLGLATSLAWSAFTEEYALRALGGDEDLPAARLVATLSDGSFVGWFVFLALGLHFTSAMHTTGRMRLLPAATLGSAAVFQAGSLVRSTPLPSPYEGVVSPWAVPSLATPASVLSAVVVVLLGLCLLASVVELFVAFRGARGETRQQLLWLVAGAAPLAPAVVASFAVSYAGYDWVAGPILSVCIVTLAVGAGLSVVRYRLYDVERVVTDSTAYALSSGAVVAAFGVVVLVITRTVPVGPASPLSTVLATLAAAGIARPAYVWARTRVDRRFNRRRFDAVRMVESELAAGDPNLEDLLRRALDDPQARLLFNTADGWVSPAGHSARTSGRSVDIVRRDAISARLVYDPARTDPTVVAAVAATAASEIDNLGLRAELARQVEQVSESRTRLATAHLDERRRMERDLHDGAQQHLLAIALQLQSARVNGADAALRDGIDWAVAELGTTVQDLRSLAHGLQPAALAGGGLRAATEELAGRIPLRLHLEVTDQRYPATLESAAWFVVAEGVANAVKHADVDALEIRASQQGDELVVAVADNGIGGADPLGQGLQGLADRVAALGGRLSVGPGSAGGTVLEAVFPCAW